MTECKVVEEVTYQQRLNLGRYGHASRADTKGIGYARHGLKKVVLRSGQGEDIPQRLLRALRRDVGATVEGFHIRRQSAEHQPFNLLLVLVIVGGDCHLE